MTVNLPDHAPPGWTLVLLGELCERPQYGWTTSAASTGDVKLLRTTDITKGAVLWGTVPFCKKEPKDIDRYALRAGDIVISRAGSIGASALIGECPNAVFASYLIRFRSSSLIHARYLRCFLDSPNYWDAIARRSAGIALQNVNAKKLASIPVPLAPRGEQNRIVDELDKQLTRLDAAVAALRRVQANLKRYRASVLKAACEGRLVPTEAELARAEGRDYEPAVKLLARIRAARRARWEADQLAKMQAARTVPRDDKWKVKYQEPASANVSELPRLPEGWVWATIDGVGEVLLGRQRAPQYQTGRFTRPYLRVANVLEDHIDYSDLKMMDFDEEDFAKYRLQTGDILLAEGQSPELVGRSAIYPGGLDGLCFQKTLLRFRPFRPGPSAKFVQNVFRAYLRNGVFRRAASLTVNIAHLTLERIKLLPFPLPPVAEQERIVSDAERHLSVIDELEASVETSVRRAERLRQSILNHAFEGKLVPQDPSDEPASVLLERIRAERTALAVTDAASGQAGKRRGAPKGRTRRTRTRATSRA